MKRLAVHLSAAALICTFLFMGVPATYAQQHHKTERVHEIKRKFLSEKLHLTAVQNKAFWPVYDQYEKEMAARRHRFTTENNRKGVFNSDAEARKYITANLDMQEDIIRIRRKYNDQLLKIISARQLAAMLDAEKDFKKILLQRLKS